MSNPERKASHLMSTDTLKEVGAAVAQQKAMERGPKFLPHGCRLFEVASGWESNMIRRDKGVATAATMLELEDAIRAEGVKVVFIPVNAMVTASDIEKICQRNGVTKTLFKEVRE
jgi:deoxyribodipyrimidine photolyase-like uncharacterized protein